MKKTKKQTVKKSDKTKTVAVKSTPKKRTKSQVLSARKAEALLLLTEYQNADRQHNNFLDNYDKVESKRRSLGQKKTNDNFFDRMNKELDKKADNAYDRFYHHMHKDLKPNTSPVRFNNTFKYKDGFVDPQYVRDVYDHEIEQARARESKKR